MPAPRTIITIMRPITRYYEYLRPYWQAALFCTLWMLLFLSAGGVLDAQEANGELWDRAVEAVQHRRYDDAVPLLDVMLQRDPSDLRALRTLASVYEMRGNPEDALALLRNALDNPRHGNDVRGRIAFDLAVLLARRDHQEEAVVMYNATLGYDAALVPVYLNRANLQVKLGAYQDALSDYERFLALRPGTEQRASIEEMIILLRETVQAEDVRRAEEERREQEATEALRMAEEIRREEEEQIRVEAEERRRKMMESVMESLGSARDDARGTRAGREDIIDFEDDLELLD